MIKVKQSLAALKSFFHPTADKGKKAKAKQVNKTEAIEELSKLTL